MEELDVKNLPIIEEDSDDEIETPVILPYYDLPDAKRGVIDTATGQIKEMSELTPWDHIKGMATAMNVEIRDPKKGCKKCYGRGWTGKVAKTGQPIPCGCIYPVKTPEEKHKEMNSHMAIKSQLSTMSRDSRRRMQKNLFKGSKKTATAALKKEAQSIEEEMS
jgi:hypothetical protein